MVDRRFPVSKRELTEDRRAWHSKSHRTGIPLIIKKKLIHDSHTIDDVISLSIDNNARQSNVCTYINSSQNVFAISLQIIMSLGRQFSTRMISIEAHDGIIRSASRYY